MNRAIKDAAEEAHAWVYTDNIYPSLRKNLMGRLHLLCDSATLEVGRRVDAQRVSPAVRAMWVKVSRRIRPAAAGVRQTTLAKGRG